MRLVVIRVLVMRGCFSDGLRDRVCMLLSVTGMFRVISWVITAGMWLAWFVWTWVSLLCRVVRLGL